MNKLLEFLIHSNIYLSLGSAVAYFPIIVFLQLPLRYEIILILFFGTFSLYTFNRYVEIKEDKITYPQRTKFIRSYCKQLKFFAFCSFVFVFLITVLKSIVSFGLILLISLIMYFYTIGPNRLKNIFFLKNFIIALCWGLVLVFLPISFDNILQVNTLKIALSFFAIFMPTFINTIIFDIRDVAGDRVNKVHTIPVHYGVKKTKKILFVLNSLSVFSLLILLIITKFNFLILTPFLYLYVPICLIDQLDSKIVADVLGDMWLIVFGVCGLAVYLLGG